MPHPYRNPDPILSRCLLPVVTSPSPLPLLLGVIPPISMETPTPFRGAARFHGNPVAAGREGAGGSGRRRRREAAGGGGSPAPLPAPLRPRSGPARPLRAAGARPARLMIEPLFARAPRAAPPRPQRRGLRLHPGRKTGMASGAIAAHGAGAGQSKSFIAFKHMIRFYFRILCLHVVCVLALFIGKMYVKFCIS